MKKLILLLLLIQLAVESFGQKDNLDYFIGQAIANSPLLKDFHNQQLLVSVDSALIVASLKPQVNGISNNVYAPVIGGWGYDAAITNGRQLSALVAVSKSLPGNKVIASQIANLQLQSMMADNNSRITEQDLKKVITDQYIIAFGEQLQLDFSNHINAMLKKEDSLLKKLTQDNVYKQTDYLAFVVTLQQQLLNAAQLEIQFRFDYTTLNYLSGIVDTATFRLLDPKLSSSGLGDISTSVFYRSFMLDSLQLINDKNLIDLGYRPKINLFADAGYLSSLSFRPYKNFGTSVGVNLSIPIYDGKQKKLQYSKIDIRERNRSYRRDFFIQQRNQQVLQLIQQLNGTESLIEQINKQVRYTETLITVNEQLLATGDIRLTDFILTLNNYFTAKNLITQNYINRLKILNQLSYLRK